MDRAFASGAKGRWFESTRAYQSKPSPFITLQSSSDVRLELSVVPLHPELCPSAPRAPVPWLPSRFWIAHASIVLEGADIALGGVVIGRDAGAIVDDQIGLQLAHYANQPRGRPKSAAASSRPSRTTCRRCHSWSAIRAPARADHILECTVAGEANLAVSGDQHLRGQKSFAGIGIMRPVDFHRTL